MFFIALTYLMVGRNHGKGLSTRSKQWVETPHQTVAKNIFERKAALMRKDSKKKIMVYENSIHVEDLNHPNSGFSKLLEAQGF